MCFVEYPTVSEKAEAQARPVLAWCQGTGG